MPPVGDAADSGLVRATRRVIGMLGSAVARGPARGGPARLAGSNGLAGHRWDDECGAGLTQVATLTVEKLNYRP